MLRSAFTACAFFFVSTAAMAAPEIGKPAPEITAVDIVTNKTIRLSSFKGKTVVLEWNNFHCPFVRKFYSVGAMQELQMRATANDVVWITINSSAEGKEGYLATAKEAKAAMAANRSNSPHYILDPNGLIGHAYDAKTTPHMFVIDKEGNVAYMGAIDDTPSAASADIASAKNYVTMAIDALRLGKPVKTPQTKSYGCFVKYAL